MKKRLQFSILFLILTVGAFSQNPPKFGIEFSGYVKTDVLWDSRQTSAIREGHFLLFPLNELPDAHGEDINAVPNFNMLSIQTRLHGKIFGPDALGAKTSGVIEGEFFGHSDGDINGFRLRHAFVKLNWDHSQLLVGQYWHPLFITTSFPEVVSFNTGAPFLPFSRNPQIAFTQNVGDIGVTLTAISQRDFVSYGPEGGSSKYLRNAGLPALNLKLEFQTENKEQGTAFQAGISGNYQVLKPRLVTNNNFKTNNTTSGLIGLAYFKVKVPELTIKAMGIYGQDMFNLTMLGGYAVKEINPITDEEKYTPYTTLSVWTDLQTNGTKWQFGLFGGYSKNLGTTDNIVGAKYVRGADIAYLYRISPRVIYNTGRFRFAPEIEYTVAAYGNSQSDGTVTNEKEIGNLRLLLGIYYFF
ncbi:MAG TPA: hypothetical protein PK915_09235 [Bacteroidales bacterium]|nr:hypothetical protein [Bacteroidales bacterium]HRW96178.1 hypothetical protein [Bacteroidales bacterium]